jgi:hypothetical protein
MPDLAGLLGTCSAFFSVASIHLHRERFAMRFNKLQAQRRGPGLVKLRVIITVSTPCKADNAIKKQ